MKINRPDARGAAGAYRSASRRSAASPSTAESVRRSRPDELSLSEAAQQVNALQEILRGEPAVRAEKIERLKAQITQGTYHAEPREIAEKLLKAKVLDI